MGGGRYRTCTSGGVGGKGGRGKDCGRRWVVGGTGLAPLVELGVKAVEARTVGGGGWWAVQDLHLWWSWG
ncbi:hypothetical protein ES708_04696 [subsurface metagenome]